MEAYVLLLIIITIALLFQENSCILNIKLGSINLDISCIFVYLVLVIFYSIRENIGYDYSMYKSTVEGGYAWSVYSRGGEFISAFLMDVASYYDDYHIYFFLVAVISFLFITKSLMDNSCGKRKIAWGILVFLALPMGFIESLSIQRQFLAIAILLYGTKYLIRKNYFKYIVVIILATMCHASSFIYIILPIVIKLKYKWIILSGILAAVLVNSTTSIIGEFSPRLQMYFLATSREIATGGESQMVFYIILLLIGLFFKKYINSYEYDCMLKLYIFSMMLILLLSAIDLKIAIRLGAAGIYHMMFIINYWIDGIKRRQQFLAKICIYLTLVGMYAYNLYVTTRNYMPFETFL